MATTGFKGMIFNCYDDRILKNCGDYVHSQGLGMEVKIGPIRKNRSQENYFHAVVGVIARELGEDSDVTKLRLKYAVLPLETIYTADGQKYLHPVSTSNLSKKEYGTLIDAALMLASGLNVQIPAASHFGLDERK